MTCQECQGILFNIASPDSLQGRNRQNTSHKSFGIEVNGEGLDTWLNLATNSLRSSNSWKSSCFIFPRTRMAGLRSLKNKR